MNADECVRVALESRTVRAPARTTTSLGGKMLTNLPVDCVLSIFQFLTPAEVAVCGMACRLLHVASVDDTLVADFIRSRLRISEGYSSSVAPSAALPSLDSVVLHLDVLLAPRGSPRCLLPHMPLQWPSALAVHFFRALQLRALDESHNFIDLDSMLLRGASAVQYVGRNGGERAVVANAPFPRIFDGRTISRRYRCTLPFVLALPPSGEPDGTGRPFAGAVRGSRRRVAVPPRVLGAHCLAYFEVAICAAATTACPLRNTVATDIHFDDVPAPAACVAIGLAKRSFPLCGRMPGWDSHSVGYHGDDGCAFHGSGMGWNFGPSFGPGDTVGCGIVYVGQAHTHCPRVRDPAMLAATFAPGPTSVAAAVIRERDHHRVLERPHRISYEHPFVFFTLNGEMVGEVCNIDATKAWYPVIGIDCHHIVTPNFGNNASMPFIFDLRKLSMAVWSCLIPAAVPPHVLRPTSHPRHAALGEVGDDGLVMAPPPPTFLSQSSREDTVMARVPKIRQPLLQRTVEKALRAAILDRRLLIGKRVIPSNQAISKMDIAAVTLEPVTRRLPHDAAATAQARNMAPIAASAVMHGGSHMMTRYSDDAANMDARLSPTIDRLAPMRGEHGANFRDIISLAVVDHMERRANTETIDGNVLDIENDSGDDNSSGAWRAIGIRLGQREIDSESESMGLWSAGIGREDTDSNSSNTDDGEWSREMHDDGDDDDDDDDGDDDDGYGEDDDVTDHFGVSVETDLAGNTLDNRSDTHTLQLQQRSPRVNRAYASDVVMITGDVNLTLAFPNHSLSEVVDQELVSNTMEGVDSETRSSMPALAAPITAAATKDEAGGNPRLLDLLLLPRGFHLPGNRSNT